MNKMLFASLALFVASFAVGYGASAYGAVPPPKSVCVATAGNDTEPYNAGGCTASVTVTSDPSKGQDGGTETYCPPINPCKWYWDVDGSWTAGCFDKMTVKVGGVTKSEQSIPGSFTGPPDDAFIDGEGACPFDQTMTVEFSKNGGVLLILSVAVKCLMCPHPPE